MDDVASEAEKIGEAAAEEKLYQLQDSQVRILVSSQLLLLLISST